MSSRNVGIQVRHGRGCPTATDKLAACRCKPTYRAEVFDRRAGKKIRQSFPTQAAAKAWRSDSLGEVRRGQLRAAPPITLRQAAEAWLAGVEDGAIRTRSGDVYKPSALRGYRAALENRIVPDLGAVKLADIRRTDLQDLVDRLLGEGLDPSTIRNALMPLRAIYRRALSRGEVSVNPTSGLELPAVRGRRDRIVAPDEAGRLLAALPEADRALWATALYAGLRRGELMALRFEDVDTDAGLIRVERSFDPHAGVMIDPKSRAGRRVVPIAGVLRSYLLAHRLRSGRSTGLAFGRTATSPFNDTPSERAARTWRAANEKDATKAKDEGRKPNPLQPITLHEARHTFASLMIAAGVNAKALSTYMGHATIGITLDRYGHLMPGNEGEAAKLLDAYLERSDPNHAADAG